jgi:hypothetical protein
MNWGSLVRAALLAPVVAALAACASPTDCCSEPGSASNGAALGSDAERLAVALADADRAFARGDRDRLTDALRRIDALGGRPLDGTSPELNQWRRAAAQNPPTRGRPLGPGFRSGELRPGSSEQLEQVFLSGKRASVALTAPNNARLTLEVQDRREAAVCGRAGNPSHCQWVPVFTDRYRIRIANPGKTAVKYFLVVE